MPPTHSPDDAEQWALLWSARQNALHIEPVRRTPESGRRAYVENRRTDYIVVHIGERSVIDAMAESMHQTIRLRDEERGGRAA